MSENQIQFEEVSRVYLLDVALSDMKTIDHLAHTPEIKELYPALDSKLLVRVAPDFDEYKMQKLMERIAKELAERGI